MLSKITQRKIFRAYKEGKIFRGNYYDYSIAYNPMALTHTWIVRTPKDRIDWHMYMPLAKEIH